MKRTTCLPPSGLMGEVYITDAGEVAAWTGLGWTRGWPLPLEAVKAIDKSLESFRCAKPPEPDPASPPSTS